MDEILNALTNRAAGFCSREFPLRSSYTPKPQDSEQTTVRGLLGLDRTDTDYFVHMMLSILSLHPDLEVLFQESARSYDLQMYRAAQPIVQNGALEHDNGIPAGVIRRAEEWPVQFNMKLTRLSTTSASLALPGVWDVLIPIVALDDRLRLPWPARSGITGVLVPRTPWAVGATLHITHEPVRFPFMQLREVLQASDAVLHLLSRMTLLEAFLGTQSSSRAVALAVAALGLSNLPDP
jgi:hypothetical protein